MFHLIVDKYRCNGCGDIEDESDDSDWFGGSNEHSRPSSDKMDDHKLRRNNEDGLCLDPQGTKNANKPI